MPYPIKKKSRWKQFHYAALVLSSGLPDDIHIIDLGDANAIDKTINKFRMSITGGSENRSIQSLQNVEKKISKLMEVTGDRNLVYF